MRCFVAEPGRAVTAVAGHRSVTKGTESGVARSLGEAAMFYGDGEWVMMIIGLIFMMLIVGLVFTWLMRMGPTARRGDDREQDVSSLEVLRRRYAAGEISDEEFDAKRRKLEGR